MTPFPCGAGGDDLAFEIVNDLGDRGVVGFHDHRLQVGVGNAPEY
jgi:hypothetical protein